MRGIFKSRRYSRFGSVNGIVTSVNGTVTSVNGIVTSVNGIVTSVNGTVTSVNGIVTSVKQYGTYFGKWILFSETEQVNPFDPPTETVLAFLSSLYEKNTGYNAINTGYNAINTGYNAINTGYNAINTG
jgi:hypothetical protein